MEKSLSIRNKRGCLCSLFEEYILNKPKYNSKTVPMYGSSYVIYFYEWSNIYTAPKIFKTYASFLEFAIKYNIHIGDYTKNNILCKTDTYHITCKKGCNEIVWANSWIDLNKICGYFIH